MTGMIGARFAARGGREPAAAAHGAREPAGGLVRPGGGTILDAIGSTPLIMVDGIWVKLEYLNPSGSIKARIARYMIERAEREGLLRPGDTIVEASSGNTGNAMSMVARGEGLPDAGGNAGRDERRAAGDLAGLRRAGHDAR
jgi:cysteine synthase A